MSASVRERGAADARSFGDGALDRARRQSHAGEDLGASPEVELHRARIAQSELEVALAAARTELEAVRAEGSARELRLRAERDTARKALLRARDQARSLEQKMERLGVAREATRSSAGSDDPSGAGAAGPALQDRVDIAERDATRHLATVRFLSHRMAVLEDQIRQARAGDAAGDAAPLTDEVVALKAALVAAEARRQALEAENDALRARTPARPSIGNDDASAVSTATAAAAEARSELAHAIADYEARLSRLVEERDRALARAEGSGSRRGAAQPQEALEVRIAWADRDLEAWHGVTRGVARTIGALLRELGRVPQATVCGPQLNELLGALKSAMDEGTALFDRVRGYLLACRDDAGGS